MTIAQGKISLDDRGCAYSPEFGDVYASKDGAYEQSRFVFLGGNRLPERWQGRDQFTIVENGFGLGTNFLTTLKAWREDPQRSGKLFYLAVEGFPLQASDIKTFASSSLKAQAEELAGKWPTLTPGVHRLTFDEGRVVLDLYFMPSSAAAKKLSGAFDAFYPDGFSPKKNPEMGSPDCSRRFVRTLEKVPHWRLGAWLRPSERLLRKRDSRSKRFRVSDTSQK